METLELESLGLKELNRNEMAAIEGGSFWSTLGSIFGYIAAAFVAGLFIDPYDYIH